MIHPTILHGIKTLLHISGAIFLVLSALTVIGVVLIVLNGGKV